MKWLRRNIVFCRVAAPEHDVLYGAVFVECHAHNILETVGEVVRAGGVFLSWKWGYVIDAVEGKSENFAVIVGGAKEEPTVVVLLQNIGMEDNATDSGVCEGVVGQADDHLVGDMVEEGAEKGGIQQVGIVAEADDLAAGDEAKTDLELVQPLEVGEAIELAEGAEHLVQEVTLLVAQFLTEDGEGAVAVADDAAAVVLDTLDWGAEGRLREGLEIFLDAALGDLLETVVIKHRVHPVRQVVDVVVMVTV